MSLFILDSGRRIVTPPSPDGRRAHINEPSAVERIHPVAEQPAYSTTANLSLYAAGSGEHGAYRPVQEILSRQLVSISPDQPLSAALMLMSTHSIHHILVIDDDILIGILGPEMVLNWLTTAEGKTRTEDTILRDLDYAPMVVMTQDTDLHFAARELLAHGQSAAVIIDERQQAAGIVTTSDFLKHLSGEHPTDEHA